MGLRDIGDEKKKSKRSPQPAHIESRMYDACLHTASFSLGNGIVN